MVFKRLVASLVTSSLIVLLPGVCWGVERASVLRFACIGDPHYGWGDLQYAGKIVDVWQKDPNFPFLDFVVNLGDFVSGDRVANVQQLQEVWKHALLDSFEQMFIPWFFAYGNHDTEAGRGGVVAQQALELIHSETGSMGLCSSFKWNNILFLLYGWNGELPEEGKEWLETMTELYKDITTIIISHAGPIGDDQWWRDFFSRNPQIKLFIHGHHHFFRHYNVAHVDVIDCGITNGQGLPWTFYFEIRPHGIYVSVYDAEKEEWIKQPFFTIECETGVTNAGFEWYAVTWHVCDGQQILVFNRILAESYELQLFGSNLVYNSDSGAYAFSGLGTDNLEVVLNGKQFKVAGFLPRAAPVTFNLPYTIIQNELQCFARAGGNGTGMVRLVYKKPLLWSDDVSIGVLEKNADGWLCKFIPTTKLGICDVSLYPVAQADVVVEGASLSVAKGYYRTYKLEYNLLPEIYRVSIVF